MEISQFISKFHNLEGNTIGEKRKSLFLLLNEIPPDADALIASLEPRTYLEKRFSLEVYLRLQHMQQLISILKSEEEHLVAKLIKNKRFCQKLATVLDENSAGFVDDVLPHMSFVTRKRLINKLAVFGTRLDKMFDEVCTRYGIYLAKDLLLGCTEAKIREVLDSNSIIFTDAQLVLFFEKHQQLFIFFVEHKYNTNLINESVIHFIARRNIDIFLTISQKVWCADLGKRLTRRLLLNHRDLMTSSAAKFSLSLHAKTVIRVLGNNFKVFFFRCFPLGVDSFNTTAGCYNLAEKLGRGYHYKLLLEGFQKLYNKSLYDYPQLISDEMMEHMDVEEREKWIVIKQKNGCAEADLIKYMRVSEAIPLIKSKINVTSSIPLRENLIETMVATCKINNNLDALAEVGEYVCHRHRNDDPSVLTSYLCGLEMSFKLSQLPERVWNSIVTVLKIVKQKSTFYFEVYFHMAYLEYLLKSNKLQDADVLEFLKMAIKNSNRNFSTESNKLKRILLVKSIEFAPNLLKQGDYLKHKDLLFVHEMMEWNEGNPNDQLSISDYPRLIESLRECFHDAITIDEHIPALRFLSDVLKKIIVRNELPVLRDEAIKSYFLVGFRHYDVEIDFWLMKNRPEVIAANFDTFLKHFVDSYSADLNILDLIKKYSHLSFAEKTVAYCIQRLGKKMKILIILAALTSGEEFIRHVGPYYPTKDRIDEDNEEERKRGEIAQHVASAFKYTTSHVVLPVLVGYCKGDYLRYCLESMYYLFYHLPGNKLSSFITDLASKAVSARKHAIFLTCTVGAVSDVRNLLKCFVENERNVSVQKHLFTAALKYLIRNPLDEFWEIVKLCMANLDKNDNESLKMLTDVGKIPPKYKAEHVICSWRLLKKMNDCKRLKLLSSIPPEVFKELPLELLVEIITENFLKTEDASSYENNVIDDFVVSSITNTSHHGPIMDTVFGIVSQFKFNTSDSFAKQKKARACVSRFTSVIVTGIQRDGNIEILQQFSERWCSLFSATEAMEEHLEISFNLFYLQSNKDISKFTASVGEFFQNVVESYGIVIIEVFASVLKKSLRYLLECYTDHTEDYFQLCMQFLQHKELIFYVLVLKLLPDKVPDAKLFHEILKILTDVPQVSIQTLVNIYIKNLD